MLVFQKIPLLCIFSFIFSNCYFYFLFLSFISMFSIIFLVLQETRIINIIMYSSIIHVNFILLLLIFSVIYFFYYLILYSLFNGLYFIFYLRKYFSALLDTKLYLSYFFLFLSGIPPSFLFFFKWFLIFFTIRQWNYFLVFLFFFILIINTFVYFRFVFNF